MYPLDPFDVSDNIVTEEDEMALSKELLEVLACPKCKGAVRLDEKKDGLICEQCRLLYPIRDGIPVMLIDEARPTGEL